MSLTILTRIISDLGYFLSIHDLVIDSRKVSNHSIFCAYPGFGNDGRKYIENAISQGAKAILYESGINPRLSILNIAVANLKHYIGLLAAYKYDDPSQKFYTIGVTGTNGKTSVTHWLNQLYTLLGNKTAIIGTTGAGIYPLITDYESTTPDPITLQKSLFQFAEQNVDITAMEVSSHALHQGRVNGVAFKTAIFTNLTQDHLDYHKTMEEYYKAKRELFYWRDLEQIIINTDDEYGKRLFDELSVDLKKISPPPAIIAYGINSGALRASDVKITLSGMGFTIGYQGEAYPVQVKLIGRFNVYNILSVVASLLAKGHPLAKIVKLLGKLTPVCGRMDAIIEPGRPLIVIDYAHTPDALQNALHTLKDVEHEGRLYCVFGCGGDRDRTKRPLMGALATSIADFSFITSDNPRTEEPGEIIKEIVLGASSSNYEVIIDRAAAITQAISKASAHDIILIAGKGHEIYQEINGVKHHFSDFEIAKHVLKVDKIK